MLNVKIVRAMNEDIDMQHGGKHNVKSDNKLMRIASRASVSTHTRSMLHAHMHHLRSYHVCAGRVCCHV